MSNVYIVCVDCYQIEWGFKIEAKQLYMMNFP